MKAVQDQKTRKRLLPSTTVLGIAAGAPVAVWAGVAGRDTVSAPILGGLDWVGTALRLPVSGDEAAVLLIASGLLAATIGLGGLLWMVTLDTGRAPLTPRDRADSRAERLDRLVAVRTAELEAEIERGRQRERELEAALSDAREANRRKSDFLAQVSHELRTPLNAIIGFSQMIAEERLGPVGVGRYSEYARDIDDSSQHLLHIVDQILDLSRLEAGRYELEERDLDMGGLIEETRRMMEPVARARDVTLSVALPAEGATLRADPGMLRQILVNLLTNAIKYTPRGGAASLAGGLQEDGRPFFAVADTGIGMTPEQMAAALEPFSRVHDQTRVRVPGVGLGLSIAKTLAELHHATLDIDSAPERGTRFTVRFPAGRRLG